MIEQSSLDGTVRNRGTQAASLRKDVLDDILFAVARAALRRQKALRKVTASGQVSVNSAAAYQEWRKAELEDQLTRNFPPELLKGKDVLDLGCGGGCLSFLAAEMGARRVHGIDLNPQQIAVAREAAAAHPLASAVTFQHARRTDTIAAEDDSCDVILCFDALEHIIRYEDIIREWRRVLRPGGRVLAWWVPTGHPYGHHLQTYAPLPWMHLVLSDTRMLRMAARVLSRDDFTAPHWDLDDKGCKIIRYRDGDTLAGYLNRLTVPELKRLCRRHGLVVDRCELVPFQGPWIVRTLSRLAGKVPALQSYFTACVILEIRKPE